MTDQERIKQLYLKGFKSVGRLVKRIKREQECGVGCDCHEPTPKKGRRR